MQSLFVWCAASLLLVSQVAAEGNKQPYKGLETRRITSLSEKDITALREGSGWGLALPAELNGYPGPAHVLELAEELELSDDQKQRMTRIVDEMRADAIAKGLLLIEAERRLDEGFTSGSLDADDLKLLIERAEQARADLRFVHLSRHLVTAEILDAQQTKRYSILRGYSSDPCSMVPDGHDSTMWRRHNGCDEL